jgi:serine/threonine protein kinase
MSDNQRILRQHIYAKDIEITTALVAKDTSGLIVQKTFKYGESTELKDNLIRSYTHIHSVVQPKSFAGLDNDLKKAKYNFLRFDLIKADTMLCIQSKALVPDGQESHWTTMESFAESYTKSKKDLLDENIILLYLTQILRALAYLHSVNVTMSEQLHEDNIFVKTSGDYLQLLRRKSCVYISDFTGGKENSSYDMWRLGVILAKIILAGSIGEYIDTKAYISTEYDSEALIKRVQQLGQVRKFFLLN